MRQTGCIKDMSPALMDENQPAIRRLAARMKHVPANLKVSPAHQWVLTSDAVNDMVACFEVATCVMDRAFLTPRERAQVKADLLSWLADHLATHAGRDTIRMADLTLAHDIVQRLKGE